VVDEILPAEPLDKISPSKRTGIQIVGTRIHFWSLAMSNEKDKTVRIATSQLKQKLNAMYVRKHVKKNGTLEPAFEKFNDLWDLKELALLERRESVDVPESWVAQMDEAGKQLGS
jgi:hypothetical protein